MTITDRVRLWFVGAVAETNALIDDRSQGRSFCEHSAAGECADCFDQRRTDNW